jgi:hypothetical protein
MRARETEIQQTARFAAEAFGAFQNPRDGAAAMAMAVTANIWAVARPANEADVRQIMARLTETVVECWKKQVEFVKEQEAGNVERH